MCLVQTKNGLNSKTKIIMDDIDSEVECEIEVKEGTTFTRLTDIVRNQYVKFLKKQLEDNLLTCGQEESLASDEGESLKVLIQKCAQNLESIAIKEATLTQLYQRAMIKTIDTVRRCTKECRLLDEMQLMLNFTKTNSLNCEKATKATQTEDYEPPRQRLTLDQRINLFHKNLIQTQSTEKEMCNTEYYNHKANREQRKRRTDNNRNYENKKCLSPTHVLHSEIKSCTPQIWHSPTPPPPPLPTVTNQTNVKNSCSRESYNIFDDQLEGDEVAEELEKLFMEQETDFEEIFGISLNNSFANCDTKESSSKGSGIEAQIKTKQNTVAYADEVNQRKNDTAISTSDLHANQSNQIIYRQPVSDLRHSPWPCEKFLQKRLLSATLTRLVEEDIRWYDILKMQFTLLFGDDDTHDDFAPCSPSLELDEVIISSCMRRISPWVVMHLMQPLEDGLIGNRFLFKKLAKKLAYNIILHNQYPNELFIKNAVANFFCLNNAVMSVEDLNDIDMMAIVNSE